MLGASRRAQRRRSGAFVQQVPCFGMQDEGRTTEAEEQIDPLNESRTKNRLTPAAAREAPMPLFEFFFNYGGGVHRPTAAILLIRTFPADAPNGYFWLRPLIYLLVSSPCGALKSEEWKGKQVKVYMPVGGSGHSCTPFRLAS